jgi:methyl-accepting chemotaxis protein
VRTSPFLTVSRKLYLAFGTVIALLVAVMAVALYGFSSLGTAHRAVSVGATPKVEAADAARSAAGDMHFSQTEYVLAPGQHPNYLVDHQTFRNDLGKLSKLTDARERAQLSAIVAEWKKWQSIDNELWAKVRAGDTAAAKAMVIGAANDSTDALVGALTAYQTKINAVQTQANTKFDSTKSTVTLLILVLGTLAVLLAGGLAYVLGRSLVGGIKQMLSAANGISLGDLDQQVETT